MRTLQQHQQYRQDHMSTANAHHDHAHHFTSREHQYASSKEGIWLFMLTEIMMFGGLFVAYAMFKSLYPHIFEEGSSYLNTVMGGINTVVLLTSSLTMALAIHYIQKGKNDAAFIQLFLTVLCACGFMVIKYFEYQHKIHVGQLPGEHFTFAGKNPNTALFFGIYFVMTGLHGIHVLTGIGLISWLMIKLKKGHFNPNYYTPVEGVGLFWHVVDLIWIFLFPLFYLLH